MLHNKKPPKHLRNRASAVFCPNFFVLLFFGSHYLNF